MASPSTRRIFVALELPVTERSYLKNLCSTCPESSSFRWEPESKLHLTLKFIGDVEEAAVRKIAKFLDSFKDAEAPVTSFTHLGFFGKKDSPSILYAGLKSSELLEQYQARIDGFCSRELGVPKEERRFHPHITLLRIKPFHEVAILQNFAKTQVNIQTFSLPSLILYESKLLRAGSVYTPIVSYQLKS